MNDNERRSGSKEETLATAEDCNEFSRTLTQGIDIQSISIQGIPTKSIPMQEIPAKSIIPIQQISAESNPMQDLRSQDLTTQTNLSNNSNNLEPSSSTPLLSSSIKITELEVPVLPSRPSTASFCLSDTVSIISAEEINQRREGLRIFSSELSMATSGSRSLSLLPNMVINYELTPFSSTLSSLSPSCRICQSTAEAENVLITPCRCDGSLKHIHATCLLKWISVSAKRRRKFGPEFCELCGYIYRKHKYVKYRDWRWPKIATRDKILHVVFAISLITMIVCAIATVLCFITDNKEQLPSYKRSNHTDGPLTKEEIITICCGITFFVSFFVSMSAEIKAKRTIYQILRKCFRHNTVWMIENYSTVHDEQYKLSLANSRNAQHKEEVAPQQQN